MLFQTFPFLFVFFPAVLILYWLRPERTYRQAVLLIASYIFYGYWDWRFCGLLLLSSLVDFIAGDRISRAGSRRASRGWLFLSVLVNLTVLGFFKYWDFFAESFNRLLSTIGLEASAPVLGLILPIGISFYTFQSMSYTIDVYRGRVAPTRSLVKFLVFVSLFPQLVSGPIVRYSELDEQLDNLPPRFDTRLAAQGLCFFIIGLSKKVLVADELGRMVGPMLRHYENIGFYKAWAAMAGSAFQLYFDFSGYSDMAVGLALMLGVRLPINFDSPYRSESLSELWDRWHISLTHWMRDYVFISLGGSRRGLGRTLFNITVVFVLFGLWHGAGWTLVLMGLYFCAVIMIETAGRRLGVSVPFAPLRRAVLFIIWTFGLSLFFSDDLAMAGGLMEAALGFHGLGGYPDLDLVIVVVLLLVHAHAVPNIWSWKWRYKWYEALFLGLLFMLCLPRFFKEQPFIYFQF